MATALVSEPPRPRVVMSSYRLIPWNPATMTIFFLASSFWIRSVRRFLIWEAPWLVSVSIPACQPVRETTGYPSFSMAMASKDMDICSPQESSTIHLPFRGVGVNFPGLFNQIVSGIPLGGNHHYYIVAPVIGFGDNPGHIKHPLGVGHGRAAEFLYNGFHLAHILRSINSQSCCSYYILSLCPCLCVFPTNFFPAALGAWGKRHRKDPLRSVHRDLGAAVVNVQHFNFPFTQAHLVQGFRAWASKELFWSLIMDIKVDRRR